MPWGHGSPSEKSACKVELRWIEEKDPTRCGIGAARILLQHFETLPQAANLKQLDEEARLKSGVSGQSLKDFFDAHGFKTAIFEGRPDESVYGVFRYLKRGVPMLLMLDERGDPIKHFVVLNGYDSKSNAYLIMDPAQGPRSLPEDQWMRAWARAGHFVLLVFPKP